MYYLAKYRGKKNQHFQGAHKYIIEVIKNGRLLALFTGINIIVVKPRSGERVSYRWENDFITSWQIIRPVTELTWITSIPKSLR